MIMYRLSIDYSIKNKDHVRRYDHDRHLITNKGLNFNQIRPYVDERFTALHMISMYERIAPDDTIIQRLLFNMTLLYSMLSHFSCLECSMSALSMAEVRVRSIGS